jgi:hypothetical protein
MALFGKNGVRHPRISVRPSHPDGLAQMRLEFDPSPAHYILGDSDLKTYLLESEKCSLWLSSCSSFYVGHATSFCGCETLSTKMPAGNKGP